MNSLSHFFKHLPYRYSRCLTRLPPPSILTTITHQCHKPTPFSTSTDCSNYPSYQSVRVICERQAQDIFSEALLSFGAYSASVDQDDNGKCHVSNQVYIDSIFPEGEDVDVCISQAAISIGLKQIPTYEVQMGDHNDWINKTQESFHPLEVTRGLWIVPEWQTPPDAQATNILLNPGLAFGTGEHPTTKLCLLLLQSLIKGGEQILDYGTGTGILAIAAIKFGAASSVGVDIDPQAIASAYHNAALNKIEPDVLKLHIVPEHSCSPSMNGSAGEIVEDHSSHQMRTNNSEIEKYDVVIANILLNPLLDLADQIVSYAKPGATVGLSGILTEQIPRIMDRYSPLLEGISVSTIDDWACISGTKKKTNLTDS